LIAVDDFPTPPLPEATTITFLTPAIGNFVGSPRDLRSIGCSLQTNSLLNQILIIDNKKITKIKNI
jgi:hypothetical protein